MLVEIEYTPNPNSIKFIVEKEWSTFIWECINQHEANKSSLSKVLFQIKGVKYLLFGKKFVVISKESEHDWDELIPTIIEHITKFIETKNNLFENDFKKIINNNKNLTELEQKMIDVLNAKVQPAVETHGGSIEFEKFENGILYLNLKGACRDCPSSEITLQNGILNLMGYFFPEIKEVKSV